MEHINRNVKTAISCIGSNITNESIQRAGKCIKVLMEIMNQLENVNGVPLEFIYHHPQRLQEVDVKRFIGQLQLPKVTTVGPAI